MKTFIQFTAGKGPIECSIVCQKVFEIFINEYKNLKYSIIHIEDDYVSGFKSVIISIDNLDDSVQKKWEGTIKYISTKNSIRPNHKRKNWFINVSFFKQNENDFIQLNDKDIKKDFFRSSGPGGQHVNKIESAVRLTHIPTNIVVTCSEQRDQLQNLKIAKELLTLKIKKFNDDIQNKNKQEMWNCHNNLERGNEKLTFKGEI